MSNNLFYARKYLYNPTFSCFLFYESNFYVTKLFNQPIGAKMFDCHAAPRLKKKKLVPARSSTSSSVLSKPPPPPPLKIYNKCSMTLHSHNPDFCSDFCILILTSHKIFIVHVLPTYGCMHFLLLNINTLLIIFWFFSHQVHSCC